MGCAQSRIENEEAVARCKERRSFMNNAVAARNAFAAAHFSYTMSLKNTGAALSDFAQGEDHDPHPLLRASAAAPSSSSSAAAAASATPIDNLPPPPPPLPDFSPSPLQRSTSMPALPPKHHPHPHPDPDDTIREEADFDGEGDSDSDSPPPAALHRHTASSTTAVETPPPVPRRPPPMPESKSLDTWDYFFAMDENIAPPPPPPPPPIRAEDPTISNESEDIPATPEKVVLEPPPPPVPLPPKAAKKPKMSAPAHHQHSESAGALEIKRGKMVASTAPSVSLLQVLTELDDDFLKASESAHEVSKMLEANRMHYHSNFADNRGHIDHSARVMRVITWNRSFKGIPNGNDAKDDFFDSDEWETHATVLDKMLAWEKKLYKEVKAGELMKIEYQRKVALLNKQKKRGANPEAIEKTKAAVSHLHTRYIVDMQSMDSTVSEIRHLRDHLLSTKLVELIDGMAIMWGTMNQHHNNQLKITMNFRGLDISNVTKETSAHHYDRTTQLYEMAKEWQAQFEKLMLHQKEYIHILNSWLKLSIIPIESSLKEKVSSPPRPHQPPIQALLHAWHDHLEKLPDDLAKSAISSFSAVLNTIITQQQEELKQKEKYEEIRKEYTRKARAFEDWNHKHPHRPEEADPGESAEGTHPKDPVAERRFQLETLKTRVDEEEEAHKKLCKQVREKSLGSLKTHLPELFRVMSEFSLACSEMYKELRFIAQPQTQGAN